MSERKIVSTDSAPSAIGPYNQAIIAGGFVHCSGQIALDPQTMEIIEGDVAAQAERCLKNLQSVLEAAGSNLSLAVKCNVYLKDMADFATVNEVYGRFFNAEDAPARACVQVAGLPKDVDVEIDCLALLS